MSELLSPNNPELKKRLYSMFRNFLAMAERRRRWNVDTDIPWHTANRNLDPAIATVVESFCAVELYLPDYVAKALPMIRSNKAWAFLHVNWGYEEMKHSLALTDWLLKSGHRTEEQIADLENHLFQHEWNLPQDSAPGMLIYAMVQELATFLHYRNLRNLLKEEDDPALFRVLTFVQVDERSHHAYYKEVVQLFLEIDRQGTLDLLKRVISSFSMPATNLLADSRQRMADISAMNIFTDDIFYHDVYLTVLDTLGIKKVEMKQRLPDKKSRRPA